MTFFTSLNRPEFPFAVYAIEENNTGETFRDAVFDALENGVLLDGDFFIMDGAAVHFSADTFDEIYSALQAAGVTPIFLPAYSPEVLLPLMDFLIPFSGSSY